MTTIAQLSFSIGTLVLLVAFAAHVGHAVLLAAGRRATALISRPTPSYVGVVGGTLAATLAGPGDEAGGTRSGPSALERPALLLSVAAFGLLSLAVLARALIVGRGPWGNLFEFSVAFAWSIVGGYLWLAARHPIRSIGFLPLGVASALALYASSLPSEIRPLLPALNNAPLLTIHVGMAVLAYGIFATAFAAGVGYLLQGPADRFAWLPSHRTLDEVAYRAVIIGFPIFATMIILGSWWASIAWSRYWGWDPKETAALVTWLTYAVYLHARNQRRWAGRPAALLLVVGFAMVLVTYSGSLWFSGLHAYSGL